MDRKKVQTMGYTAQGLTEKVRMGYNIGDCLDAFSRERVTGERETPDGLSSETLWHNPRISDEYIYNVKKAGFDALRLPVTWFNHVEGADHTIEPEWLDRVQHLVDVSLDAGLITVLDSHHDVNRYGILPSDEYHDSSVKYITDIWSQIARRFAGYDSRLVMEAFNEVRLPRDEYEWHADDRVERCRRAILNINDYNRAFVNAVYSAGGENTDRVLMTEGYAACIQGFMSEYFELPETAPGKLMLSWHCYGPVEFCFRLENGENFSEFDPTYPKSLKFIHDFEDMYRKFISKGIPVWLTEWGSVNKDGNLSHRIAHAKWTRELCRRYHATALWWDNGKYSDFALADRKTGEFTEHELLAAILGK